jgi:hypothetical protein
MVGLCGAEHHVIQNYHYIDRDANFFPCAGSRGCQNRFSAACVVEGPVVVVLRQFDVGILQNETSRVFWLFDVIEKISLCMLQLV